MKTLTLPKRSGGTRTLVCPGPKRKKLCRDLIPALQRIVRSVCDLDVVHGFAELRSPVTNAVRHVGYEYTLSFDLASFFDTVQEKNLVGHGKPLAQTARGVTNLQRVYRPCFHKGIARQGLPTSPIVANIAAAGMDSVILSELKPLYVATLSGDVARTPKWHVVYTRYADDLTFSFDSLTLVGQITRIVTQAAEQNGFAVNPKKTRLQSAKYGRRIITGIAVDKDGIYPTRQARRKLRAAIHNAKTGRFKHFPSRQWMRYTKTCKHHGRKAMPKRIWVRRWLRARVRGLEEWLKLTPPKVGRRSAGRIAEALPPAEAIGEVAARKPATMP